MSRGGYHEFFPSVNEEGYHKFFIDIRRGRDNPEECSL